MAKDANYIRLINTSRWRRLRLKKLQAQPLCELCQQEGKITPASEVHHIVPVESVTSTIGMEKLMYDYQNLMSVCPLCHSNIHAEMFSHSRENCRKANARRVKRFIDNYL